MKIYIENYTIYENKNEIILELAEEQVVDFPFMLSTAFVSKKNIDKGVFFISTKDKKEVLILKGLSKNDLNKLKNQENLIIGLLENNNKYNEIYKISIKKTK